MDEISIIAKTFEIIKMHICHLYHRFHSLKLVLYYKEISYEISTGVLN